MISKYSFHEYAIQKINQSQFKNSQIMDALKHVEGIVPLLE